MTGPLFPDNFSRVWVRGTFIDLAGNPRSGSVRLTPSPAVMLNRTPRLIISGLAFTANLDPATGSFAVQVPATDDPDIVPVAWTYSVLEPTGRSYNISVPESTPVLDSPGDPLHGQRVIDLVDVVPAPSPQPGTVQLVSGRGVASATINGAGELVLTYTDGTSAAVGLVPSSGGGPPSGGAGGVLSGNYPNPGFAVDMATQAEADAGDAASVATAASDATAKVSAHRTATDPHGDRAAATAADAAHVSATDPHGDRAAAASALSGHTSRTDNPHSTTKAQVGLGSVANLAPADLPISTATQTALDGKSNTGHTHAGGSGLPAAAASQGARINDWVHAPTSGMSGKGQTNGVVGLHDYFLPAGTYDTVGLEVYPTAGSAGAVATVVVYGDDGTGYPGTLLAQSPTFAVTSTGQKTTNGLNLVVPAGGLVVWAGAVLQGSPSTSPDFMTMGITPRQSVTSSLRTADNPSGTWRATGITGTAPSSLGTLTRSLNDATRLGFRRTA